MACSTNLSFLASVLISLAPFAEHRGVGNMTDCDAPPSIRNMSRCDAQQVVSLNHIHNIIFNVSLLVKMLVGMKDTILSTCAIHRLELGFNEEQTGGTACLHDL